MAAPREPGLVCLRPDCFNMKLMLKRAKGRHPLLGLLFLVSVVLTIKSSSDDLPRWLRGTRPESWLLQFSTGNQNIHDIAVGIMVSLFIYLLVVRLPERDKRKRPEPPTSI